MSYYFEIQIILPENETQFSNRKLSKTELSEVTQYLQQKTSRGIPVKFRVGIYSVEEQTKIMSVTLNTKNMRETDIINLLLNRVTDREVLVYLNQKVEPVKDQELKISSENQDIEKIDETNEPVNNPITDVEIPPKKEIKVKSEKKLSSFNDILTVALSVLVILSIAGNFIQQGQIQSAKKENKLLSEKIEDVRKNDLYQSKIDTFGRYFLTNYFAQEKNKENYQSSIRRYVLNKVNISDWKMLGKTLKNVNFYGSEKTKNGYSVTYVLNVLVGDRSKMQKVTFEVEQTKDSFLVKTKPILTDFSFY